LLSHISENNFLSENNPYSPNMLLVVISPAFSI